MAIYGTVEGCAEYGEEIGAVAAVVPDGDLATALARAAAYIDGRYGKYFAGRRTGGYAQELEWPRTGAATADGYAIPAEEIPPQVIKAAYQAAFREFVTPGSLSPDYVASAQVVREKIDVIETTYATASGMGADAIRPVVTIIDEMLRPFLVPVLPAVLII
jgi:hypothetical protein